MRINMNELVKIGGIEGSQNPDIAAAIRILKLNGLLIDDSPRRELPNPGFPTLPNGSIDIGATNRANCPDVAHGGREEDCQDNDEGA